jgi:hypothetical protein
VIRGYGTAREHLAEVIDLAATMFEWRRMAPLAETDEQLRRTGELEFEIARKEDVIAARVAATTPRLPFDLACDRFDLSETERRVLALLVALEVRPRATRRSARGVRHACLLAQYRAPRRARDRGADSNRSGPNPALHPGPG